ncbi:helix-turn-helix domain-containing protein [Novimethylophilus kurashikiensis]|uniref:helix-turn-helix domain-containing protein n=1 Tax=Novimethylophilus kurashikiensis TaxID=1825523 RepID=UPI001D131574|nr:helix-turn-helix transcriptional regulator [Novimethylophilus kurashikiensis]
MLKRMRMQLKMSQEALAHQADVERNYISLLELGRNSASLKIIFKIVPALNVSVSEFMRLVEEEMNQVK